MLEYHPVSVKRTDWLAERQRILHYRLLFADAPLADALLIDEHGRLADNENSTAFHYLATLTDEPAGYLCIRADGKLHTLAARQSWPDNSFPDAAGPNSTRQKNIACHDDITAALLRAAIMESPRCGLSTLWAETDATFAHQLPPLGFVTEASSTATHRLQLRLPPDRSQQESGSELIRLQHIDDFRRFSVALTQQSRQSLIIFSEDLESWLYDHEDYLSALMTLVQKSRHSSVRILLRDTSMILEQGHRLLRASQQASEKITIRTLPTYEKKYPSYLIADDDGLLFRPDAHIIQGIGYTHYRARVKPLIAEFDALWHNAYTDPDLRRLSM
jgi:hypothetical protein